MDQSSALTGTSDLPARPAGKPTLPPVSFREAAKVWAKIGLLSFGGPAGQIALMHRVLVDEKRWIGEARFLHALNYCMLLPGPEAQQLATYIGWLMHRTAGGLVAGLLFIWPGVVAIMALSWLYAGLGEVPAVQALFFGLKAAVLAIVVEAVIRIGRRALRSRPMIAIAAAAFIAIFVLDIDFPFIVLAAGLLGYVGAKRSWSGFSGGGGHGAAGDDDGPTVLGDELPSHARPGNRHTLVVAAAFLMLWLLPVAVLLMVFGPDDVLSQVAVFFSKMAVVTFGGAYAVLAYVAQEAVQTYHWLAPGEMLDGLGMAETTPGPLIMVLQFVGFMAGYRDPGVLPPMVAGTLAGLLATWVTFAPCFLWIFLGAPYVEVLRGNRALSRALSAITAAVVGVVLNLAVWFALHTLFRAHIEIGPVKLPVPTSIDVWATVLAVMAALLLFRLKAGVVRTLAACSAVSLVLYMAGVIAPAGRAQERTQAAHLIEEAIWRNS